MRALVALALAVPAAASAQPAAQKITVGIYAPSVEFGTAQARLAYVQSVARAIETATGIPTSAQSYANLAALEKDKVDFAILDAQCYATHLGWKLLASASIGGGNAREWALHAAAGSSLQALRGKKLAFISTGCNDAGFVDHAMFGSELEAAFFGARVGKLDLSAAVAEVASYKTAQAVFAPVGSARSLVKVFDTGTVPNPAFVEVAGRLPASVVDKVGAAIVGFGGGGAIAGWSRVARELYTSFAARFARNTKAGVLATPELVKLEARELVLVPPSLDRPALVDVTQLYVRPLGSRME